MSEIETPFAIDDYVFNCQNINLYYTAKLIVPPGKKSIYQNTAGWKKFQKIVEVGGTGYEFEDDGIRYKIDENNTVSVTSKEEKYTGDIVIPSQVNYNNSTYQVTRIDGIWGAFQDCTGLTSIIIPNSVTSIGSSAS